VWVLHYSSQKQAGVQMMNTLVVSRLQTKEIKGVGKTSCKMLEEIHMNA